VILQEQLQKLLLVSPLHFVVILDCVRLVRSALGRRSLRKQGLRTDRESDRKQEFGHRLERDTSYKLYVSGLRDGAVPGSETGKLSVLHGART